MFQNQQLERDPASFLEGAAASDQSEGWGPREAKAEAGDDSEEVGVGAGSHVFPLWPPHTCTHWETYGDED